MKPELIEVTMWRTMKILRVFNTDSLLQHINMTHVCTRNRVSRYLNLLLKNQYIYRHGHEAYQISATAPAQAPIFRKVVRKNG